MGEEPRDGPGLGRGVGVGEPQAPGADVADRGPAEDPGDLRGGAPVVGDREDVGDARGEAVDPAFFFFFFS